MIVLFLKDMFCRNTIFIYHYPEFHQFNTMDYGILPNRLSAC